MILQFRLESHFRSLARLAFVQHPTDVGGYGYKAQQMFAEQLFACFDIATGKDGFRRR
jgi:hypothetical protein